MAQVFISYASVDATFADLARLKFEQAGIEVWLDQGGVRAGAEWRNAIDEGISGSDTVVVVITPESCQSAYVTYEWAFAMGQGKTVIPLLLEDAELHPRLAVLQYLDFRNPRTGPWDELFGEIAPGRHRETTPSAPGTHAIACERILEYLDRRGLTMIRFNAVREYVDPKYDDDFLLEVIRQHHKRLRSARVMGKQGLART